MLRKWTLKILPREPKWRMTSKISFAGLLEHLRDRALTEVQPVIRAFLDRHELLQAVDGTENGFDAAPPLPLSASRILRMAGEANFVFFRDRHHALQEVGDALPVEIGIDWAGNRQRRILLAARRTRTCCNGRGRGRASVPFVARRGTSGCISLTIPARAVLRIIWHMPSSCRSRSGSCPAESPGSRFSRFRWSSAATGPCRASSQTTRPVRGAA